VDSGSVRVLKIDPDMGLLGMARGLPALKHTPKGGVVVVRASNPRLLFDFRQHLSHSQTFQYG
jgi:hypothetical protein